MKAAAGRLAVLALFCALAACSPEVTLVRIVKPADTGERQLATFLLGDTVRISLPTGYERVLAAGSRWNLVGSIPQGSVYKPAQGVLTVEGANIHEAYLVVREGALNGFYLPVEQGYSPLGGRIPLLIQAR